MAEPFEPEMSPASGAAGPGEALLERIAEAIIFASEAPVQPAQIAAVYAEVTGEPAPAAAAVTATIDRLNRAYAAAGRTFSINAWAGGYRMATDASVAPFLKAYFGQAQERKLSRSLLETLAILVYRQPVTKPELDFVRGVDSDYALRKLLELGLIDVVGRSEALGRPLLYGTTARFLEAFGLEDLEALPQLREIEELLGDPAFNRERALLLMPEPKDPPSSDDAAQAVDS